MFTTEQIHGLNVALNEATLGGVEYSSDKRTVGITFRVLTLPPEGPPPTDSRVSMVLSPVGRLAASYRHGRWDDPAASVEPFPIERLLEVVQSFKGCPIYGWEFFDIPDEKDIASWRKRLSLDLRTQPDGNKHSLTLFQETQAGTDRILDLKIWFDEIRILRPDYSSIPLDEFIAGGKRWWDGLYKGDPRTQGQGIVRG